MTETAEERKQYEIKILVGPCGFDEANEALKAVSDLAEVRAVGGAASLNPLELGNG